MISVVYFLFQIKNHISEIIWEYSLNYENIVAILLFKYSEHAILELNILDKNINVLILWKY